MSGLLDSVGGFGWDLLIFPAIVLAVMLVVRRRNPRPISNVWAEVVTTGIFVIIVGLGLAFIAYAFGFAFKTGS